MGRSAAATENRPDHSLDRPGERDLLGGQPSISTNCAGGVWLLHAGDVRLAILAGVDVTQRVGAKFETIALTNALRWVAVDFYRESLFIGGQIRSACVRQRPNHHKF